MPENSQKTAQAEAAEQARRNAIFSQIGEIDRKLTKTRQTKTILSGQKTALAGEKESWNTIKNTLESDPRNVRIVTKDIFEGEMADKLAAYMNTVDTDINTGIRDTGNLLDTLQTQIGALVTYEGKLMAQKATLISRL